MENEKDGKLSDQELSDVNGGVSADVFTEPLYKIGDMLQKRNKPDCYGRVISTYKTNGRNIYRLMGSGPAPEDIEENELEARG